ncbi:MAG: universal stress protein [Burkholderiaceae bacterium]|jgi:nucleotide-binding universal stress UspA family protein|nr:universal stress protein [Burkholderiaceae bacterium]
MKILVPVDGSKYSRAAIDFVGSRATLAGASPAVQLLNVQLAVPPRAARLIGKAAVTAYYDDESKKALKGALSALKRAGLAATSDYAVGHPAEEIARRADEAGVDLIAMGSHGHGALASLLFGSVTLGVLGRTSKPLLLLRGHGPAPGDSLKVGIAVDGSAYGVAACSYVLKHLPLFGARPKFTVIHVVPEVGEAAMPDLAGIALPAYSAEEIRAMQQQAFDKAVGPVRRLFDEAAVAVDAVCLSGPAGDEIAAHAKKKRLDLLVMGSHGYGAVKAAVLGSVAQRVAARCATPLLLIREA